MRKTATAIMIATAIAGVASSAVYAQGLPYMWKTQYRPDIVRVYETYEFSLTLVDDNGHLWGVDMEPEDLEVGDHLAVLFDTKGTNEIYDDEVVDLQYVRVDLLDGYLLGEEYRTYHYEFNEHGDWVRIEEVQ